MFIESKQGFEIGDKKVTGFEVSYLRFKAWSDLVGKVQGEADTSKALTRERLKKQVKAVSGDQKIPLTDEAIMKLPIATANKILSALDGEGTKNKPEKLNQGDGVSSPALVKLGTPLGMGAGKEPVTELEFSAKTFGDIEGVLSASNEISQTVALIETCARPIGKDLKLSVLPSTSVNSITVTDGVYIMREILPLFLEEAG